MDANRLLALLPKIDIVALGSESLVAAQNRVLRCEACDTTAAEPFSTVLDVVRKRTDCVTDYILFEPAKCNHCGAPITETTMVVAKPETRSVPSASPYFDSPIEETDVVFIDERLLRDAEGFVGACEHCSDLAEHSFDQILDSLTGCDPTKTEYVICREVRCPGCHSVITEKTLVNPI